MVYRNGRKVDSPEEMEGEEDSGDSTTLIPKSLLPDGVKAGDEVRLKVVHAFDGEFEVSYAKKEKSDNDSPAEPKSDDMEAADNELESLATPAEA